MPENNIASTEHETTHLNDREVVVIISALMLAMLLAALDQTIVSTALPKIAQDLDGINRLPWVATAYLLTSSIATPLYGKISDLFGRKAIFQSAILIFLIGSALCGLSRNMTELIYFRGLQGIGAGGLMSLSLAVMGDIVSPRERGRYSGYFGAVFGLSSIIGPLLGGYFTDHLSWRWVFYVNLPLGILAMTAIATRLHLPRRRTEHAIDYLGAALLAASITCLLLPTIWGGVNYPWISPQIIGLLVAGAILAILFLVCESRAKEPIIPLRLFNNEIFSVSVLLAFVSGVAMFAAIIYLPVYQQIIRGYSATKSGLFLLPLVLGLVIASISSGRIISHTGKYKIWPLIGTLVTAVGLWLFSRISLTTSPYMLALWMIILGLGIGMYMQVTVLAIQNSIERSDMGTGTSLATFFRSLGAAFGSAIFGSILISRLDFHLKQLIPGLPSSQLNAGMFESGVSISLPPAITHDFFLAFTQSFHDLFLWCTPIAVLAFIIALFLKEVPLKSATREMAEGEGLEPLNQEIL